MTAMYVQRTYFECLHVLNVLFESLTLHLFVRLVAINHNRHKNTIFFGKFDTVHVATVGSYTAQHHTKTTITITITSIFYLIRHNQLTKGRVATPTQHTITTMTSLASSYQTHLANQREGGYTYTAQH